MKNKTLKPGLYGHYVVSDQGDHYFVRSTLCGGGTHYRVDKKNRNKIYKQLWSTSNYERFKKHEFVRDHSLTEKKLLGILNDAKRRDRRLNGFWANVKEFFEDLSEAFFDRDTWFIKR